MSLKEIHLESSLSFTVGVLVDLWMCVQVACLTKLTSLCVLYIFLSPHGVINYRYLKFQIQACIYPSQKKCLSARDFYLQPKLNPHFYHSDLLVANQKLGYPSLVKKRGFLLHYFWIPINGFFLDSIWIPFGFICLVFNFMTS